MVCVLALVAGGRLVYLTSQGERIRYCLPLALAYGVLAAALAYWCTDLVPARGLLQRAYFHIGILGGTMIALACIDVAGRWGNRDLFAELSLAGALRVCSLLSALAAARSRASRHEGRRDHLVSSERSLPGKYRRSRPLKTALETLFRLLPCPEPVAFYRIGDPGPQAPVFVTGNYELTVRRVARALTTLDCRLLVCDSRGVNIWCASMAGHFGTHSIIDAIRETNLSESAERRNLILPQLCASNVSLERLSREAGYRGEFGPLDIADAPAYLDAVERGTRGDPGVRSVTFPARRRVEMALGSPIILLVVLALVYNFLGLWTLAALVPFIYLYSALHGLVCPFRPISRIGWWAIAVAAIVFVFHGAVTILFFPWLLWKSVLTLSLGMGYLVTEFTGWSPLVRYSLLPRPVPRVRVEGPRCTGCERCLMVCPKRVFELRDGESVVCREEACVGCRSCFTQCPADAIRHSEMEAERPQGR